jgi:hypothetical protein
VSEAQLLSMFYMGEASGDKKGYKRAIEETTVKRAAVVYIDRARQGAYDQQSPNTDPWLAARIAQQKRKLAEEEQFKQLLDVNTKEVRAIRAHPGGIKRSGVTNKYITQKLRPINLTRQMQQLDPDGFLL